LIKTIQSFSIQVIDKYDGDDNAENAIIRLKFLSDGDNSHHLIIPPNVLKKYASTILGKYIVAKYDRFREDVRGHAIDEVIVGYIPPDAKITFEDSDNGTFAVVDGVISKLYANDVYEMYKNNGNERAVSVELTVQYEDGDNRNPVSSFNITGVTLLGKDIEPSCRLATSSIVKFSIEQATRDYIKYQKLHELVNFANDRRKLMEGKIYKIDKSKESISDTPWGEVDKTELRNKIMKASNRASLVKDVYMDVEEGWEDAPSGKLKYPVMELKDDTFVYNRGGLSSALGYAKTEGNKDVVNKVESIYKKLDLDDGKGGDKKMEDAKKLAIEGREAWGEVIKEVQSHEGKNVYVDSIEKDHIIYTKDGVRYRVEADVEVGKDDKTVKADIKWDTIKKDRVQKMQKEEMDDDMDDCDCEDMSIEKAMEKIKKLEKEIREKKNIIMDMQEENKTLKEFRKTVMEKEKVACVNDTIEELKDFVSPEEMEDYRKSGLACDPREMEGWKNMVKAKAFEVVKDTKRTKMKKKDGIMSFSSPVSSSFGFSVWERL
jgi:hypothetical protein